MLYNLLSIKLNDKFIVLLASVVAFVATFLLLAKPFEFLPRDGGKYVIDKDGKRVEVNKGSSGKVTGVGLVMVIIFLLASALFFVPLSALKTPAGAEFYIYLGLMAVMMITGFLDDASKSPWGELVKGILDLIIAVAAAVVFVKHNPTDVVLFKLHFHIPVVLYVILAVALIWGSVNVTNCTDGVDGLCGTVSVIELFAFSLIFGDVLKIYSAIGMVMAFVLVAYLTYNWNPSTVLMGDAGSRTIGFLLALLAMKSMHPFAFVLLSFVFLFDGGLGLLKLALLRTVKINLFKNIRFPFHDHLRKNLKWSIPKIVIFFAVMEIIFVVITGVIVNVH